jgi:hypothetical protein
LQRVSVEWTALRFKEEYEGGHQSFLIANHLCDSIANHFSDSIANRLSDSIASRHSDPTNRLSDPIANRVDFPSVDVATIPPFAFYLATLLYAHDHAIASLEHRRWNWQSHRQ